MREIELVFKEFELCVGAITIFQRKEGKALEERNL